MKPGRDTNSEPGLLVAKGAQRRRASRNGCFRGRLKSRKTTNSFMFCNTKHVTAEWLACVASVSVQFGSKERVTRVHVRVKNGASKKSGEGWGRKEGNACRTNPGSLKTAHLACHAWVRSPRLDAVVSCHKLTYKMFDLPLSGSELSRTK